MNEDRILDRPDCGFWVVADGMGGHEGGDVAATRLIEALDGIEHSAAGFTRLADIVQEVERVNAALFSGPALASGGATLVVLLAHEDHYACLWAGDSRAYRLRKGELAPITHDHSVVQRLVDDGLVREADRRSHPSSHVVTRAIGADSTVELERRFAAIEDGDIFLLCSDGLTGCVEDHEIANVLAGASLSAAADQLLNMALERQAPDNVSLIIARAERSATA